MRNYNLCRCDNLFPDQKCDTYVNEALGHSSQIDYILTCCPNDINNFMILDPDVNLSDHLPLSVTSTLSSHIGSTNTLPSTEAVKRHQKQLRWDKADLCGYYNHTGCNLVSVLSRLDVLLSNFDDYDKIEYYDHIEVLYNEIVDSLNNSAKLYVPERIKSFYKFWWNEELNYLKESSIKYNRLWKAVGKPRTGPLFQQRQSSRLQYRKRLREERQSETTVYTNGIYTRLFYVKMVTLFGNAGGLNLNTLVDAKRLMVVPLLIRLLINLYTIFLEYTAVMILIAQTPFSSNFCRSVPIIMDFQSLMNYLLILN